MNPQINRRSVARTLTVTALVTLGLGVLAGPALAETSPAAPGHAAASGRPGPDCSIPVIAAQWEKTWNGNDPAAFAALFTADAVYIDNGVGKTSTGLEQIATWQRQTHQLIEGVQIKVLSAVRKGDTVTIHSRYSGQIYGAPHAFSVPGTTVLKLRHGKIAKNTDDYSGADLLAQSGLPADWTPPTA